MLADIVILDLVIYLQHVLFHSVPVLARLHVVLIFEVLLNATAMFNHANISLPAWLEPSVRRILVTPDMHRTHHSVIESERNSNYGFCLSIWDRWLGTYTAVPRGHLEIGLHDWREPSTVATLHGTLGMPFLR